MLPNHTLLGCAGLQKVLACAPANVTLHIYGMNWSDKMWVGHDTAGEAAAVQKLVEQGRVVVRAPELSNSPISASRRTATCSCPDC